MKQMLIQNCEKEIYREEEEWTGVRESGGDSGHHAMCTCKEKNNFKS